MKKRLLSAFMALALCLTLLPAPAWAEETDAPKGGETTAEAVAKVTMTASGGATWSKEYTDLLKAFNDACLGRWTENDTTVDADTVSVELLKRGETYTLETTEAFPISFEYGHSCIIDLNGCTLKRTVREMQQGILLVEEGDVTVKNGTLEFIVSADNYPKAIEMPDRNSPALTLEDMTINVTGTEDESSGGNYEGIAIYAGTGNLSIKGGTYGKVQIHSATVKLYGGRYDSVEYSSGYAKLLAPGYIFTKQDDGTYIDPNNMGTGNDEEIANTRNIRVIECDHKDATFEKGTCTRCGYTCAHETIENGICTVCKQEMKAQDTTGKYYLNLQDAFAGVADGGTVTMLTDDDRISFCNDTDGNPVEKTVTLMMNGKSLSFEGASPLYVESGKLIIGDDSAISQPAQAPVPAVWVDNNDQGKDRGTLEFQGKATITGGLLIQNWGKLEGGLKEGTIITSNDTYSVSVERSETYSNVLGLLGDGLAFAKKGNPTELVNGNVKQLTEDVIVVAHKHSPKFTQNPDENDVSHTYLYICDCGFVCPHDKFTNSICDICHTACTHDEYDSDETCARCHAPFAVRVEHRNNMGLGSYELYMKTTAQDGNDVTLQQVFNKAEDGSTVTLLVDGLRASGEVAGKTITLDLNGKTINSGSIEVGHDQEGKTNTPSTLKITGSGSIAANISVGAKGMLDLSGWTGGTISTVGLSKNGTDESVLHVGENAGTIGRLEILNWPTDANDTTYINNTELRGGSYHSISITMTSSNGADKTIPYSSMLAEGYAFQYTDKEGFVEHTEAATYSGGGSISNVKVVKCPHEKIEKGTCAYCGKTGIKATIGSTVYTDIAQAVEAWLKDGGTLKLYADYTAATEKATWTIVSGEHSIDLNGHMMSVQGDGAFFKPTNNMHLTVTDDTERGQITNILLDGSQNGSFTLESGYVHNLKMTDGAVVTLKGGSVDKLDVQKNTAKTNLSIQGGSLGELNIEDWDEGMHVSATGGSLGAYKLPSGKILADVLDHQYYAEGTSLDKQVDTAQPVEEFVIRQAPHDFGSTSKTADVPINGSIPFMVDSPSENVGVYEVKWYRRTTSGAEHMTENRVAGVNVNDTLDVFCVITGLDRPNNGTVLWQVAVKDYTIKVVPAKLNDDRTVITQKPDTGNTGNPADNRLVVTPFSSNAFSDVEYKFEVTYNRQSLELGKDYTIKDSSNRARNAGTHTLTIEGIGNYTGQKSVTWTLEPYELSVENFRHAQINKAYDGTDAVTDSTNGINGLAGFMLDSKNPRNPILSTVNNLNLDKSDYELSNMKFDSAEAGDRTFTGTMTLKPDGNFVFADGSRVMQIEYGSSGLVSVSINRASIAAPAAKALQVANNHAATYTVDLSALLPALEAPRKYGAVTYGAPTVNLSSGYYTDGARVEDGKLILPIQAVETSTESNIGTVTVKVTSGNIVDFTLTINVNATNKIVPTGEPTLSAKTLTYGQALSAIKLSGKLHDNVNNKDVEGMFTWADGTVKPSAGSYEAAWKFTPTDGDTYAETTGTVTITVNKAKPTGDPIYTRITAANKTLKDAALKPNASWPTGTIQWVDKDGKELENTTEVKANTAYKWIFTPTGADAANYTKATGELTLYSVSTGGGGGGGSSSGSTVKTDTVTNPDGSVTKTETKSDGTVVETTTGKDGSVSQTTTNPNGSSVTETKAADGSTGTVKTDKHGQTTAETTLSNKAIEDAKRNGEPVTAPVEVKATRDSDTAPTVKIELPRNSGETKVEIPVSNATPGTVAVLVHTDGTEEIVRDSIPTENGVQLTVNGDATVKVMDNSKNFTDTAGHWSEKNIDFVSARGLLNGTSANTFSPNAPTTRAQLWTVLARQADADLTGGANWYEKAQAWAKEKGISDGVNPNGTINRAQMVTMLWRAMGQPAAGSAANFIDVPTDAYYASAVSWAVENGITTGVGGGRFVPTATCTRAQIAAFLARSMK